MFDFFLIPRLLFRHRNLLVQMTLRNIQVRYRGSVLGFVWSFAQPLLMLAVYTFVFGIIFKARWGIETLDQNRAAFPLIMFCGLMLFNLFAESVNTCSALIVQNPSFVKKVVFPLELLPLSSVATTFIFGVAWICLLLAGILVFLPSLSWTMLLLPLLLLPMALFTAGVSYAVAAFGVYLRDMPQLTGVVTQVLFFMTPIFYPVSLVPENLRWLLEINPLTHFVEETRKVLLYAQQPDYTLCLGLFFFSLFIFQLGAACFCKMKKGFADVL
ncbi:MAG: ABC transporter permease [Desulfovibrio sp.]|nr:ABC transporter permease [Desulfovibrio sp.]